MVIVIMVTVQHFFGCCCCCFRRTERVTDMEMATLQTLPSDPILGLAMPQDSLVEVLRDGDSRIASALDPNTDQKRAIIGHLIFNNASNIDGAHVVCWTRSLGMV